MLFHDLLDIDDGEAIYLIEPCFNDLMRCELTEHYLSEIVRSGATFDDLIQIKNQDYLTGIGVPMHSEEQDFWMIFANVIRRNPDFNDPVNRLCERANSVRIVETTDLRFMDAIIEYYSIMLVNRMLCEKCIHDKRPFHKGSIENCPSGRDWRYNSSQIFSESRVDRLVTLLETIGQSHNLDLADMNVLEICCGNGMATIALHELNCNPLCLDSDRCAVCEGLEHDVLVPHRSMVLDATELSPFFDADSFDCVIGFMLGAIYPFNKDVWKRIMSESAALLRKNGFLIFTVHKNEEIAILKEVLDDLGMSGKVIDNRDEAGMYDQWVYVGQKL